MSMEREELVPCPKCGMQHLFTVWSSLNVTVDPDQKERVLNRELFTFQCRGCGERSAVFFPMLGCPRSA